MAFEGLNSNNGPISGQNRLSPFEVSMPHTCIHLEQHTAGMISEHFYKYSLPIRQRPVLSLPVAQTVTDNNWQL